MQLWIALKSLVQHQKYLNCPVFIISCSKQHLYCFWCIPASACFEYVNSWFTVFTSVTVFIIILQTLFNIKRQTYAAICPAYYLLCLQQLLADSLIHTCFHSNHLNGLSSHYKIILICFTIKN